MSDLESLAYVDSSGLVKLAVREVESQALVEFLAGHRMACSSLALTEVVRAVVRSDESARSSAVAVLARVIFVETSPPLLRHAARLLPPELRSLDAIHVASALSLGGELNLFVTYDRRMREAAERVGLRVESPGAP
ncbi:MAG: type II toxin-antitoxin system VapC family toxin [Dehalococcoidia bacterium]